jgi:hypothetical protein
MQAKHLGTCQADAIEQLAKSEIERVSAGWTVIAHPSMPVIPHQTVRSLADRGLCRILQHSGRETARITQSGRKAWREIEAARVRIRSAA